MGYPGCRVLARKLRSENSRAAHCDSNGGLSPGPVRTPHGLPTPTLERTNAESARTCQQARERWRRRASWVAWHVSSSPRPCPTPPWLAVSSSPYFHECMPPGVHAADDIRTTLSHFRPSTSTSALPTTTLATRAARADGRGRAAWGRHKAREEGKEQASKANGPSG